MSAREPLLRATGISRRFGARVAVAPLDFELRHGETVGLVGSNGAGKSTLLSLLAGSLPPSSGELRWEPGARVGWVPQQPAQYARLTPRENLELFARLGGDDAARAADSAARLLAAFALPGDGGPSGELSVGNRQRLNLAIGLLGEPDALLLDEPTASLDGDQRKRLWTAAGELRATGGALVFATQNLEELAHADRVLLLADGRLELAGTVAEYLRSEQAAALA